MTIKKNISQLENYLDQLDSESVDIDDAVNLYSKGVKLANKTLKQLEKATLTVEELDLDNL